MSKDSRALRTKIHGFGFSDIGGRKSNQDSFFCNDKLHFYLVADGVGGHSGGDIASLFTSEKMNDVLERLLEHVRPDASVSPIELDKFGKPSYYEDTVEDDFYPVLVDDEKILRHALWFTNEELRRIGKKHADKIMKERGITDEKERKKLTPGTTIIAVWFRNDKIIFMNVGDSRAYIIWDGAIQRVTHDHSRVEDVIREGEISPREAKSTIPRNVITRCLGVHEEIMADFYTRPLHPGMRILLCSDGLYDVLESEVILEYAQITNTKEACSKLVKAAKAAGEKLVKLGKKKIFDNITAVLIDVGGYTADLENTRASTIDREDSII